jgi:hypothetical protein
VELTSPKGNLWHRFFRGAPTVVTDPLETPEDAERPDANTSLSRYGWSTYMHLLVWIFGEAILGVFFYELATYMPDFVKIIVCGAAIIIWYDYRYFQKRTGRIYTGPLLLLPLILALLCFAVWRFTGDNVWARLIVACECVQSAYIVVDRMSRRSS